MKIVLQGDAQAQALSLVLGRIGRHADTFTVEYLPADVEQKRLQRALDGADVFAIQTSEKSSSPKRQRGLTTVTFPHLELRMLWPMNSANASETKRFPYGDSFITSAAKQGVAREKIARIYLSGGWSESWPNIDKVFQAESIRLSALDAKNDVKIGSYILKHFKRQRLFWTVNTPSNRLLAELAFRVLHAALGQSDVPSREEIAGIVFEMGVVDLFGAYSVPVHPFVANHFGLQWRDADEPAIVFGEKMAYNDYVEALIDSAFGREQEKVAS